MLETARPGEAEAPGRLSMRVKLTACGLLAFALCERNTRPRVVDPHSVLLSAVDRCVQLTSPPRRVPDEKVGDWASKSPPIFTQSPHWAAKSPVNSLQCWSR